MGQPNSQKGWKDRVQWWKDVGHELGILVWEVWPKTKVKTWMGAHQTSTVQGRYLGWIGRHIYMFLSEERHKLFSCAWSIQWYSLHLLYFMAQLNISVVISLSKRGFSKCSCLLMCRNFLHREPCFCWPKKVNTCWFSGSSNKNTEVYLYSGGQNEFQNDSAQIHNQPSFPLVPPPGLTTLSNPFLWNPLLQVNWNPFSLLP